MSLESNSQLLKISSFLKESYIHKVQYFLIDSNLYLDYLKFRCSSIKSFKNTDFVYLQDVNFFFDFLIRYKLPLFNFDVIDKEVYKKLPEIILKYKLNNKEVYHELDSLKKSLNFSKFYFSTDEELAFSEKHGFFKDLFTDNLKDNRTDLLILLCAINNNLKVVVTRNIKDFIICVDVCKEHLALSDLDLLICSPSELYRGIEHFKLKNGDLN